MSRWPSEDRCRLMRDLEAFTGLMADTNGLKWGLWDFSSSSCTISSAGRRSVAFGVDSVSRNLMNISENDCKYTIASIWFTDDWRFYITKKCWRNPKTGRQDTWTVCFQILFFYTLNLSATRTLKTLYTKFNVYESKLLPYWQHAVTLVFVLWTG